MRDVISALPQNLSDIVDLLASRRQYASFFEWINKEGKEFGVAEELVAVLNADSALQLHNLAPCDTDPPDLRCEDGSGHHIAIEVSEIVCEEAVRLNQQGHKVYRVWEAGELQAAITQRLARKDQVSLHGGPCDDLYVCLFTDEMMLATQAIRDELASSMFGPFKQITAAFLLFSYDAHVKGYPVVRLRIVE